MKQLVCKDSGCYRNHGTRVCGGGVALLVRENNACHACCICLKWKYKNTLYPDWKRANHWCSVPPVKTLLRGFESVLMETSRVHYKRTVVVGDFNIYSSCDTWNEYTFLESFSMCNVITQPTRNISTSRTLIFHALCNAGNDVPAGALPLPVAGHLPIFRN